MHTLLKRIVNGLHNPLNPNHRQTPLTAASWLAASPTTPRWGEAPGSGWPDCLPAQIEDNTPAGAEMGMGVGKDTQQENKSLLQCVIHEITECFS